MKEALRLAVHVEQATDEEIAAITRELCLWINEAAPGCEASPPPPGPGREGDKGIELGFLAPLTLVFLQTGGFNELVNCLATYIKERRRKVSLTVQNADGKTVQFQAENLNREEIDNLVHEIRQLAGAESVGN